MSMLLGAAVTRAADPQPFAGDSFPTPPQQSAPWMAPSGSTLPDDFLSATKMLHDLSLPDPRGCEYREVSVTTGSVWGAVQTTKVHGFLMPAAADQKQRFAILWNGLVYPVSAIGPAADLRRGIDALVKAASDERKKEEQDFPGRPSFRDMGAAAEESAVSEKTLAPLKACLLVRFGETARAEELWAEYAAGASRHFADHPDDPFLAISADFLWARFDRAVTTHMRGDDRLCLIDSRGLTDLAAKAEKIAEDRGYKPEPLGANAALYNFVAPAADLASDAQRRLAEKPRLHVLDDPKKFPDQTQRIAVLIDDLENENARQMGQPGGVDIGDDPIVRALIAEGDAAVGPLLDCFEKDTRLTRSVHFGRDFSRYRSLTTVSEAAYVALSGILGQSFFAPASTGDDLSQRPEAQRAALAAAMRDYWQKNKGKSQAQRWFAVLADDKAPQAQWEQAAEGITRASDVDVTPASQYGAGWISVPARQPGEKIILLGEALRNLANPSVGELLSRRLHDSMAGPDDDYSRKLRSAEAFTTAMVAWNGQAHLKDLQDYSAALLERYQDQKQGREYLCDLIAGLTRDRIALGDNAAIAQYAAWIKSADPADMTVGARNAVIPLWLFADTPEMARAAEELFNDPKSPWYASFNNSHEHNTFRLEELSTTPLLGVPAYQKQLLRLLDNTDHDGTIQATNTAGMQVHGDAGWGTGINVNPPDDPDAPKPGQELSFRVCDDVAATLSRVPGFPMVQLYWPESRRDAAVKLTKAVLVQYGARIGRDSHSLRGDSIDGFTAANFSFPALDHPATAADVAAGRAIFSDDAPLANRRLWKLPQLPLAATWENLHTTKTNAFRSDPLTNTTTESSIWVQDGQIWQAEETLTNGKWERWYGFIGRGFIGKVPGSEVILQPDVAASPADKTTQWRLEMPGTPAMDPSKRVLAMNVTAGEPVLVKLHIRNLLGIPQQIPAPWYQDGELVAGVSLHVQKADSDSPPGNYTESRLSDGWKDVPLRFAGKPLGQIDKPTMQSLDTGGELPAEAIDLASLGITSPGLYRVWLEKKDAPYPMRAQLLRLTAK